jgi:hypothetical protein
LRLALPFALVLGLGGFALGVYNRAVTGDPLTLPYAMHQAQYGQTPMLLTGESITRLPYRHAVFDDFHSIWEKGWYQRQASLEGWLFTKFAVTWLAGMFFLTPVLIVAMLACRPRRWHRLKPAIFAAGVTYAATLAVTWYNPHYWAPFVPIMFVAATAGLRRIDVHSRKRLGGIRLSPWLVAVQVALFLVAAVTYVGTPQPAWAVERTKIADQLESLPGRHLIFVSYGPGHNCHAEWVFNAADIDGSKVVWARNTDPAGNAELMRYFGDRQAWLLEPEAQRMTPVSRNSTALTFAAAASLPEAKPRDGDAAE